MADRAAKEARAWAEGTAPSGRWAQYAKRAGGWLKWVMDFVSEWPYEEAQKEEVEVEPRQGEKCEVKPSLSVKHEIWNVYGTPKCRRCARKF